MHLPLFPLGKIGMTQGVNRAIGDQATSICKWFLDRHVTGDWGPNLCDEDRQANWDALEHGDRILSKYEWREHQIYVITEADRSSTMILLVEEY